MSGCTREKTLYSIAAEPLGEQCSVLTIEGEHTPKRTEFEDTHQDMVSESYVLVDGEGVYFGPWQGDLESWFLGDALTHFPTADHPTVTSVEMDYACTGYGPEIARVYWICDGRKRYVVVSLMAWQHQSYRGFFIETDKQEHHGRLLALYAYEGQDFYGEDLFLYQDHVYLYEEDHDTQIGSQDAWLAAEEAAIRFDFGISP